MPIGLVLGLINGTLIAFLGIPPIVVTLGTLAVYRGMIIILAGGDQVNASEMSAAFQAFPKVALPRPHQSGLDRHRRLDRCSTSSSTSRRAGPQPLRGRRQSRRGALLRHQPEQAGAHGLRDHRGVVAGLCGYLWVSRYGVAYSEIANGYELTVIAACVIGGVSIGGGVGTVSGTLLGALFLGIVMTALPVLQISPFWQMAISGAVILAAVIINARAEQRPDKLILPEARRVGATPRMQGARA